MTTFLTDSLDINRFHFSSRLNLKQRSELGQFLTPAPVARFMAGQFNNLSGNISLLDPGAGVGSLTAAFVERLLINSHQIESCLITTYEVEETFLPCLEQCLIECCNALKNKGIKADYCLRNESFIGSITENNLPLFNTDAQNFTHAILNPPYKKISSKSIEKKILSKLGIETVNLYSAFVWLSILQLAQNGEIVAITPRSFCNGSYFRPFRKAFLEKMAFQNIHIFASRSLAFAEDNVLQENIIFHAAHNESQNLREMGVELDPHGKMPDVVVYYQKQDWLILIEAVTSHGPVDLKRHNELKQLFKFSSKGLVFMTAFPTRKEMTRYLAEIAWETEVWVADQPDHLIHFNGERFLGPYENR